MQACHTCRIALAYAWSRFLADAQRRYSVRYGMWTATSIHTLRSMLPVGLRILNVHEFNIPRFLGEEALVRACKMHTCRKQRTIV